MAYKNIKDAVNEDVAKRGLPTKVDSTPDGPMELFSLRIATNDKRVLQEYFKKRGLKLSQGIPRKNAL